MYWIQESGNSNNANYKSFICDYKSDIDKLPTQTLNGALQNNDTVSSKPVAAGSDCLCLEDSSVWILGKETDSWQRL